MKAVLKQQKKPFNLESVKNIVRSLNANMVCPTCKLKLNCDLGELKEIGVKEIYNAVVNRPCMVCGGKLAVDYFRVYEYNGVDNEPVYNLDTEVDHT